MADQQRLSNRSREADRQPTPLRGLESAAPQGCLDAAFEQLALIDEWNGTAAAGRVAQAGYATDERPGGHPDGSRNDAGRPGETGPHPESDGRGITRTGDSADVHCGGRMLVDGPETSNLADSSCELMGASEPSERRAFPRRESGCVVSIHRHIDRVPVSSQDADWLLHSAQRKGLLLEISMNGLSVLLSEPIERGETILLRLANRRFDQTIDATADVFRCLSHGDGTWKIVCRLQRNLSYEQMHLFGQHLFPSPLV